MQAPGPGSEGTQSRLTGPSTRAAAGATYGIDQNEPQTLGSNANMPRHKESSRLLSQLADCEVKSQVWKSQMWE